MDSDTTARPGDSGRILQRLDRGEIDILIGTQMITKGHDFPAITLVGVVTADASLNIPDFRAAERTFQILTQVSGRGGRGDRPGRVVIQTFAPGHYAIRRAQEHDYAGFYADELPCAGSSVIPFLPPHRSPFLQPEEGRGKEGCRKIGARARERPDSPAGRRTSSAPPNPLSPGSGGGTAGSSSSGGSRAVFSISSRRDYWKGQDTTAWISRWMWIPSTSCRRFEICPNRACFSWERPTSPSRP